MHRRTFLSRAAIGLTLSTLPAWPAAWAQSSGRAPDQTPDQSVSCAPAPPSGANAGTDGLGAINLLALYARNRAEGRGHLVTEAALLHVLALSLKKAEREFEAATILPLFGQWTRAVAERARMARESEAAAALARDFALLVAALAAGEKPGGGASAREAQLIMAAGGTKRSPLLGVEIDYSGFRPRGRYDATPELRAFFVAQRYAGSAPFFLKAAAATQVSESRAQLLFAAARTLSGWMNEGATGDLTKALFGALERAFGAAEDYSALDFAGETRANEAIRADWIAQAAARGRRPSIVDVVYDADATDGTDIADLALSWRFLPGRRLPDAAALQALVYPRTGAALDAKGGAFSLGDVRGQKVKAYVGLDDYFALFGAVAPGRGVESGFGDWDRAFAEAKRELFGPAPAAGPPLAQFLKTVLTPDRPDRLVAAAGHYVHYRHSRLLYAKQSSGSDPKGLALTSEQSAPFLATDPAFAEALATLAKAYEGQFPGEAWAVWRKFGADLPDFAAQQAKGCVPQAVAQRLNRFDRELAPAFDAADDHPIIVDIHSAPSEKRVVEIGLGFAQTIERSAARGGAFTVYQFKQPSDHRLTDAEFAAMLQAGDAKALAWPLKA